MKKEKAIRKVSKVSNLHAGAKAYREDLRSRHAARAVESKVATQPGFEPEGTKTPKGDEFKIKAPGKLKMRCECPADYDNDTETRAKVDKE
jgi:hypothetical protein